MTIATSRREHADVSIADVFSWNELPELLAAEDLFEGHGPSASLQCVANASIVAARDEEDADDDFEDDEDDDFDDEDEEDDEEEDDEEEEAGEDQHKEDDDDDEHEGRTKKTVGNDACQQASLTDHTRTRARGCGRLATTSKQQHYANNGAPPCCRSASHSP